MCMSAHACAYMLCTSGSAHTGMGGIYSQFTPLCGQGWYWCVHPPALRLSWGSSLHLQP